jgi:hypothetical protein
MKLLCASILGLAAFALTANGVSAQQADEKKKTQVALKSKPKPNAASKTLQDQLKQQQEDAAQKDQSKQLENSMKKQQAQLNKQISSESKAQKNNKANKKTAYKAATVEPHP